MRRYVPGKGLEAAERAPGTPRSTAIRSGRPPRGRKTRVAILPETNEIAVSVRGKILRRKLY